MKGWMDMWKTIKEFPNYEVSDMGEVKSKRTGNILKTQLDICGYNVLQLYTGGKRYYRRVHRLVAEEFLLNTDNLPEVNHKNAVKTDNYVDNLEWCTSYENLAHARQEKLLSKASRPVVQLDLEGNYIREFESATLAAKHVGAKNPSGIISVCNKVGHCKTAKGFKWRYKDAN
jgi:hypothetical protein